jgi:uncharacterized membrane protein YeaQ/YmgE (transglycosylase-associated protein family)
MSECYNINYSKTGDINMWNFILFILIGAIAGALAGRVMRGGGFGLIGNIVVGVIGGFLGGWLFGLLGISFGGIIGSLVTAFVGAVILLLIVGLIKK